jgi:hypothetical protein
MPMHAPVLEKLGIHMNIKDRNDVTVGIANGIPSGKLT